MPSILDIVKWNGLHIFYLCLVISHYKCVIFPCLFVCLVVVVVVVLIENLLWLKSTMSCNKFSPFYKYKNECAY